MNTFPLLQRLFDTYDISLADRCDIIRIYELLPSAKKANLVDNFSFLSKRLKKIEEDLQVERDILTSQAVLEIRKFILEK